MSGQPGQQTPPTNREECHEMSNRKPWEAAENMALASLYFTMLEAATSGTAYNKAAMIREKQRDNGPGDTGALVARSRGSIEAKLMNASAAHQDLMRDRILPAGETMATHGYKAWGNYQATLRGAVLVEAQRRIERQRTQAAS
jgi:hypothetical protein